MEDKEYKLLFNSEDTYWWHNGLHSIALELLPLRHFLNKNGIRVLDAGCGTGGWLKKAKDFFWATGIDISEKALSFSAKRGLDNLVKADVINLPFKADTFDIVTAFDILYHRRVVSDTAGIKEFCRVL
ncbi:MAG: class I SAM-dependent methyltransferase, partial [Candidatus Omnitrophica bacterium]|nr:class I SAM-dependent methyltransferase [Candidatus Omnitrophota bacterium]